MAHCRVCDSIDLGKPRLICSECGNKFIQTRKDRIRCSTKCNLRAFKKRTFSQEWPRIIAATFDDLTADFICHINKINDCFIWNGPWEKCTGYGHYYFHGKSRRCHVLVFKWLKGEPPKWPLTIDHKCGNKLCVNPDHLRIATQQQNASNRADSTKWKNRFIGVSWRERDKNWTAKLRHKYKYYYAGPFQTDVEAAKAYNEMAIRLNGEFATINKIPEEANHAV